jgi:DNA-directed RNA polymerase subunit K/omega
MSDNPDHAAQAAPGVDGDYESDGEEYGSDVESIEGEDTGAAGNIGGENSDVDEDYNSDQMDDDDNDLTGYDSDQGDVEGMADDDNDLMDAWRELEEDDQTLIETVLPAEQRTTSNRLSRYEMVELLSLRASAIERGAQCFIDTDGMRNVVDMAKKEIYSNRCPLLVKRAVGLGLIEIWDPNTMEKPLL